MYNVYIVYICTKYTNINAYVGMVPVYNVLVPWDRSPPLCMYLDVTVDVQLYIMNTVQGQDIRRDSLRKKVGQNRPFWEIGIL